MRKLSIFVSLMIIIIFSTQLTSQITAKLPEIEVIKPQKNETIYTLSSTKIRCKIHLNMDPRPLLRISLFKGPNKIMNIKRNWKFWENPVEHERVVVGVPPDKYEYNWSVPGSLIPGLYKIKVKVLGSNIYGSSEEFTIKKRVLHKAGKKKN
jgi:hypothetical protein